MLPPLRQRVCIVIAAAAAGLLYLWGGRAAFAAGGEEAATLLGAASPAWAVGWFVLLSVPAAILGGVAAAMGNPIGGVFVVGVALLFPAAADVGIDPWLRAAPSSAAYWSMVGEGLIWAAILTVATLIVYAMSGLPRSVRPAAGRGGSSTPPSDADPAPREATAPDPPQTPTPLQRLGGAGGTPVHTGLHRATRNLSARSHLLLSGLTATAVGFVLAAVLVRSADPQQALWGVGLAFLIGGVLAHQFFPAGSPLGVLLSPLLAAVLWYAWAALSLGDARAMLYHYYTGDFPHAALALPIHYASAGVAGAAAGVGWSHALFGGRDPQPEEEVVDLEPEGEGGEGGDEPGPARHAGRRA